MVMQEVQKPGLGPGQGKHWAEKKDPGEKISLTTFELRNSPNGKLEKSLGTRAETGYFHRVKFK